MNEPVLHSLGPLVSRLNQHNYEVKWNTSGPVQAWVVGALYLCNLMLHTFVLVVNQVFLHLLAHQRGLEVEQTLHYAALLKLLIQLHLNAQDDRPVLA